MAAALFRTGDRQAMKANWLAAMVLLAVSALCSAQDKGLLSPKPLPALANPSAPHLPAKSVFSRPVSAA